MDPSGVLAGVNGDFEIAADPDDPAGGALFVSNIAGGVTTPQNVVIARLDGTTGQTVAGSLTVVATNFQGDSSFNGPEWMRTPQGQLGIVYVGADGVHGVFRSAHPANWNSFLYDYTGTPTFGAPPVLPDTAPGYYNGAPSEPPAQAATIPQYGAPCTGVCFGAFNVGRTTDVRAVMAALGFNVRGATQAPWDKWVYVGACRILSPKVCSVYQVQIDGAGGIGSLRAIGPVTQAGAANLSAILHPTTGTALLFTDETPNLISVWTHALPGTPLALIGQVTVPSGALHFRTGAAKSLAVLNYLVKTGPSTGSYTIAVGADGSTFSVGDSNKVSTHASGAEFHWYPAAGQWGLVYRSGMGAYHRCWVTP